MFKKSFGLLIFIFGFVVVMSAQERKISTSHATMKDLNCSACHDCNNPTRAKPCLKLGVSFFQDSDKKITPDKLPADSVIIYDIEERYGPVKFSHKKHLHMAVKLGDCVDCHHHSDLNSKLPLCQNCHGVDIIVADVAQADLKAAYHRKCMGCHVEWSKNTDCNFCHILKGGSPQQPLTPKPALHEPKRPDDLYYLTHFFEGPYVKFSHQKHSSKEFLACADCHAKRNCIACHYQDAEHPTLVNAMARPGVHGTCMMCHDVMGKENCGKCHSKTKQ